MSLKASKEGAWEVVVKLKRRVFQGRRLQRSEMPEKLMGFEVDSSYSVLAFASDSEEIAESRRFLGSGLMLIFE